MKSGLATQAASSKRPLPSAQMPTDDSLRVMGKLLISQLALGGRCGFCD